MECRAREPMIYIVYGKARSGKNTVSNIIRKYYEQQGLSTINIGYAEQLKKYAIQVSDWNGDEKTKPRTLLQELGTDLVRNKIDNMFFVNRLMDDIKFYSYFFDVITISDARFINEIETPKQNFKNVKIIKLENPNLNNGLTSKQQNHISETELDHYRDYDYLVSNDKDIKELEQKIKKIVSEVE